MPAFFEGVMMRKWLAVVALLLPWAASAHAQTIGWEVVDRFRLWDRARTGDHVVNLEQLLDEIAAADGPAALQSSMLRFLTTQSDLHEKAYWRTDLETYDREYIWPTHYRVRVSVSGVDGDCNWSSSIGSPATVTAPCSKLVELTLPANESGSGSRLAKVKVVTASGQDEADIQVRDRLVASIGDSFASGEGNPDVPMDLSRLPREFAPSEADALKTPSDRRWTAYRFVGWKKDDWTDRWLGRGAVVGYAGGARWWDPRCHRSFYSQHMVAALRYAAARPKEATTFVSFACSGAETFAGLLVRQSQPPGYRDGPRLPKLTYPQVEVLVANLCPPSAAASSALGERRNYENLGEPVSDQSWVCAGGRTPRPIDALLVTDGGNDIGFGPVIQDALLPRLQEQDGLGHAVLKQLRRRGALSPEVANDRINKFLPKHYEQLRKRISEILPPNTPVLQSVYPNPLFNSNGTVCGGDPAAVALTAIGGFWPDKQVDPNRRWKMHISTDEAIKAEALVVQPLNTAVREHLRLGATDGWRVVDDFEPAFARRGWCASGTGDTPPALPNWNPDARQWTSWSPASWIPYASRARLFRTPNDAAMTQQPANPRRALGSISPLFEGNLSQQQESLLSAMAGSFHPTFEAHTIMGWSVGQALVEALPSGAAP